MRHLRIEIRCDEVGERGLGGARQVVAPALGLVLERNESSKTSFVRAGAPVESTETRTRRVTGRV